MYFALFNLLVNPFYSEPLQLVPLFPTEYDMQSIAVNNAHPVMCTLQLSQRYTHLHWQQDSSRVQERQDKLDRFLAGVERSAFRMAEIATRNPDDAMDIVQEAMIKLVEKYADKPAVELRPLFYRILQSRITDHYRKNALRKRVFQWLTPGLHADDEREEQATEHFGPPEALAEQLTLERLVAGLNALPLRQRQAFMLRTWQGLSVAETARIMNCAEGSVKTHLFRATHALKKSINYQSLDNQHG